MAATLPHPVAHGLLAPPHSRAKRLKKLARILAFPAAQSAIMRFRLLGLATICMLLAVHVVAFAVTDTSVAHRFE